MSEENKKEPQETQIQGQETKKQETSLSEQDLKEVSGGTSLTFSYEPQKPDGSVQR